MRLRELQDQHEPWQQHNFPTQQPWEALLGAQEELGELSHAYLKAHQGIRGLQEAAMRDALGDIVIYLAGFCNLMGIDFESCVESAWAEVKDRDWQRFPGNGVDR